MLKKFRIGFDPYALLLFVMIMLPNFVWFAITAPNDVLRMDSVTPVTDAIASICQVVMVALLILVVRKEERITWHNKWVYIVVSCGILYLVSWLFYYQGIVNSAVILSLCIFPCMAFLFYAVARKHWIAMVPAVLFSVLHLLYGVLNLKYWI